MRKRVVKVGQFPLEGARINSINIGRQSKMFFVTGDSLNTIRLYTFDQAGKTEQIDVRQDYDWQMTHNAQISFSSGNNANVQNQVSAVALNAMEDHIFSGSNRGIINMWSAVQRKQILTLKGHSTSVNSFGVFINDENRLASGSYDTNIKLWDIRDKNNTATLRHHTKQINAIDVSPDSRLLLSGSEDDQCKLWDLRYPERLLATYSEHKGAVLKVRFNPENCYFASCSMDKTAKCFTCDVNKYNFMSTTDAVATPITAIDYSNDGTLLYTASNDTLKTWSMVKRGKLIEAFEASWKNVLDICTLKNSIIGVGFSSSHLMVWLGDFMQIASSNKSIREDESIVLPRIHKGDRQAQLQEVLDSVDGAMNLVRGLEGIDLNARKEEQERRRLEQERKRAQDQERKKQEELRKEQEREERERQKQQRDKQLQALRQKRLEEQRERKEAERERQEQLRRQQQEQRKRQEEELIMKRQKQQQEQQQRINDALHRPLADEMTLMPDHLDNSSLVNLSAFMGNGAMKERIQQKEIIDEILREKAKFESYIKERQNKVKSFVHFWKAGKGLNALDLLTDDYPVISDCVGTAITNPRFKTGLSPEVGVKLVDKLIILMNQKRSTFFLQALILGDELVRFFKEDIIKLKSFNPMGRVDLSRQERVAKYDKLIDAFLTLFQQERLKKYSMQFQRDPSSQINAAANKLYICLEELLRRIIPRQEPEPA